MRCETGILRQPSLTDLFKKLIQGARLMNRAAVRGQGDGVLPKNHIFKANNIALEHKSLKNLKISL